MGAAYTAGSGRAGDGLRDDGITSWPSEVASARALRSQRLGRLNWPGRGGLASAGPASESALPCVRLAMPASRTGAASSGTTSAPAKAAGAGKAGEGAGDNGTGDEAAAGESEGESGGEPWAGAGIRFARGGKGGAGMEACAAPP